MRLVSFRVRDYRNVIDSGDIDVTQITALVGQNESGKSNLCEALYRLNPFDGRASYDINEDWPADKWGDRDDRDSEHLVCEGTFVLDDPSEIDAFANAALPLEPQPEEEEAPEPAALPSRIEVKVGRRYNGTRRVWLSDATASQLTAANRHIDTAKLFEWSESALPKCVYIEEYHISGAQVELDQLAAREKSTEWDALKPDDQAMLIVLELARIDLEDLLQKGESPEGRTLRTFDNTQASAYLTKQFELLWDQKGVNFRIEVDATTLNIFVQDEGFGMPIRLNRRSLGFRWFVSFAWLFTHATRGKYKECVLLLEEPGIHLHHAGHANLLGLFERLAPENTIIYTTHIATMLDTGAPERVRIVEVRDHHTRVLNGIVSQQKHPMMVIEAALGLAGSMSGLLGGRQTVIVEGGTDALILQKLSGVFARSGEAGLSERIYLFPAASASKTPMYAGFLIGQKWDAAVLLDSDPEGNEASKKIKKLYLDKLEGGAAFRVFMLGKAAGISKTDVAIEDLFPESFYLECVNQAYGTAIGLDELPQDGSTLITKRVEQVLQARHRFDELDKARVLGELLRRFDNWKTVDDLPPGTADPARALFKHINDAFSGGTPADVA